MTSTRRTAVIAGACYLVTHLTSTLALALYGPVLSRSDFVIGSGRDVGVLTGGLLEVVCALAIVGTRAALFPVVKRHTEGAALAYAALRTLEAAIILVGVASLLAVVTLRQHAAGTAGSDAATLLTVGKGLVAVHNWTFLLGPEFVCAADTLVLAYAMWRSRLIPRFIAGLGLAGGSLLAVSGPAILFGLYQQVSAAGAVAALPVFAWELCLAIFLIPQGLQASRRRHQRREAGRRSRRARDCVTR